MTILVFYVIIFYVFMHLFSYCFMLCCPEQIQLADVKLPFVRCGLPCTKRVYLQQNWVYCNYKLCGPTIVVIFKQWAAV